MNIYNSSAWDRKGLKLILSIKWTWPFPSVLRIVSDQKLGGRKAWEQGYYWLLHTHTLNVINVMHTLNQLYCYYVQLVPAALQVAMSEDIEFRRALPLDYLDYMGVVNADTVSHCICHR